MLSFRKSYVHKLLAVRVATDTNWVWTNFNDNDGIVIVELLDFKKTLYGSSYSRMDLAKFEEDSL